jgi:hypothetical protein
MDESGDGYDLTRVLDASGGDPTICLLFACLRSGISVTLTPSHTQGIVTGRSHSQGDHTHREITLTGRSHSQGDHTHREITLTAIFGGFLDPFFEVCWRDDLLVSLGFLDLRCWSEPVFGRFWTVF